MTSSVLAVQLADPRVAWAPIVLLIIMALGFAVTNVVVSILIGPRRSGKVKATTYESGMVPVGDTHRRFNVRFYIVAMIFLVIDVDIIFFYPWATIFAHYVEKMPSQSTILLVEMIIFAALLLLAYVYAWGKGVFRWD
ncbi:MAG TPA: NADH-quinone oxidoreductase subunit A [Tepidisphaeraceae bacterium]|jgi:NADH-quinone oxidoreductase subunit A|nr:NADH-quinone oxidoreductase subunit A [Tepidisphaeraceae bacterium]